MATCLIPSQYQTGSPIILFLVLFLFKLTLFFAPTVSLSSSVDATSPQAFPDEKEEGVAFGKKTQDTEGFASQATYGLPLPG